jgi:metal-responsive CopG/Arc/MetJ family transcriptional regulator
MKKINIEIPDEWETRLDELAEQDGHSNRSAVIRKIISLFFAKKLQFSSVLENEATEKPQEQK